MGCPLRKLISLKGGDSLEGVEDMLKVDQKTLEHMESQHEGIIEEINRFEEAELPHCPNCGSSNTASVQVGIIGRTIYLAGATTKFKLIPNGPKPGDYFCNECEKYFNKGGNIRANSNRPFEGGTFRVVKGD
jgi:hypothetical protein